jgi:DNA-binding response OmpR family regulator
MAALNVMLVEDDADMGMIVSHTLRSSGYQVTWAKDGIQAMQMAKQFPPALIVSDFMFPAGGGASFFQRLRMAASTQSTPIIILSAVPKELIAAAVGADVNAYCLPKPYKKNELLSLVEGLIQGTSYPELLLHSPQSAPPSPKPKPSRGSVLVVSGNGEDRALIRTTLLAKDFSVAEAGDGAEAMSALGLDGGSVSLDAVRPGLIVIDAEIDFGAGHLINARLSREATTHSVPVVVITGGKDMRAAFSDATNVAAYLNKPLDPQRLLRHAEELIPARG